MSLRHFLSCHNLKVTVTDQLTAPLKGSTNEFIMQRHHLARYSEIHQRDINLVRLHLQVSTLADLSDPTRNNAISLDNYDARRPATWQDDLKWPRQPTISAW